MATDKLFSKAIIQILFLVSMFSCSEPADEFITPNPKDPISDDSGNSSGNSVGSDTTDETGESTNTINLEDITRDFTVLMENLGVPGAQVAVVSNEKLVYLRSFGLANTQGPSVDDNSLLRIGGISKPITLLALSQLVRQGLLDTDDTVFGESGILGTRYGSAPYPPGVVNIRVQDLITHRSGFTDYPTDIMFEDPTLSQEALINEVLNNRTLAFAPGTAYTYSNFGYCVLGRIIETVSGKSYEQYVREAVLAPMGISDMQISKDGNGARVPGEVSYYSNWQPPQNLNVTRMDAHGGWLASAYHLALLAAQSDGGGQFPDLLNAGEGLDYLGDALWFHNGALPGTTALLRVNSGISYVVLMNRGEENFQEVIQYITNFMNQKTLNRSQWPQVDYFRQL
ncbi:beta-lactamase family protein [Robiginitalea sp.]|nr:beta-lactamase family protein [Robiginitalea sp.]